MIKKSSKIKTDKIKYSINNKDILNGISLDVYSGEFVGLIGPNGCGKTTLLKILYKALKQNYGAVYFGDENIDNLNNKNFAKRFAILAQEHEIAFNFRVIELMHMSRFIHKQFLEKINSKDNEICEDALRKVGMLDFKERDYFSLSGGEKQRIMIAMAMAKQSELFILDEPTNHLDIHYQLSIMDTLKIENQLTILASIHDLNIAAKYCDKLILMNKGKVITYGDTNDVLKSKHIEEVFNVKTRIIEIEDGQLGIFFKSKL